MGTDKAKQQTVTEAAHSGWQASVTKLIPGHGDVCDGGSERDVRHEN